MHSSRTRRLAAGCCAAVAALGLPAVASASARVVKTQTGAVRGAAAPGGVVYRGVPYAAAPTGARRWRAPQPPAAWSGVRDATQFAPNCPQPQTPFTAGETSEDCLYLNISTPSVRSPGRGRPVLVWFHGGGFALGAGRDYDPAKLAATGTVVVTVNYRLGALGFLAHPALADHPGGPSGNYGLMDQQAALRWVRHNIAGFGGDPRNVTIAGQSAGGLSVLMHLVSAGSRGLFSRAIVQSGAFALKQQSLAAAEKDGQALAAKAGCTDQTATCLRKLPVSALVAVTPPALIPGVVDGAVLKESVGTALAAGRFAHVPVINGTNHDEERLFLAIGSTVSNGTSVPLPEAVTAESYEHLIASSLGVSAARAAAIAAHYPLSSFASPAVAFSQLQTDANFTCPALQVDRLLTAHGVPTYAYELNEDRAPERFVPQIATPTEATHQTELQFLFGLPDAPIPGPLTAAQERLGTTVRAAWSAFAADGDPSAGMGPDWPSFTGRTAPVLSLVAPHPRVVTDVADRHSCGFWTETAR